MHTANSCQIYRVFFNDGKNLRDDRGHLEKQLTQSTFLFQPFEGHRRQKPLVLNVLKVE